MSLSDAGTPPLRGLAKLRSRSKGLASASTNSLNPSSGEDDSLAPNANDGESGGLRASMETAIGKVKERTRRLSIDTRPDTDDQGGRLSAIISKTKRRVKRADRGNDAERNGSIDSETAGLPASRSDSSLLLNESGRSSLLTYDEPSDSDGSPPSRQPIRPSLTPRDSHAPYLTLSSPQISAFIPGSDIVSSPDSATANDLPSNIPQIIEPDNGGSPAKTESPAPTKKSRSPFALARKKSSGEDSTKSGGGGSGASGLSGLFKTSSRTNSISSQPPVDLPRPETSQEVTNAVLEQGQPGQRQESAETPKVRGRQKLQTSFTAPATLPNLVEPPRTLVTPPTPTDSHADAPTFSRPSLSKGSPTRSFNSVESIRHRRAQSATFPSKLSTFVNAPLTPTVEEAKTPGGTLTQPSTAPLSSGFFSSVFSAAQKAGAQFSSTINTSILPSQKPRPESARIAESAGGEEVIPGVESEQDRNTEDKETKPLAVATLGHGSLSLSHLGILDNEDSVTMGSTSNLPQADTQTVNGDKGRKVEEEAAARAVSTAYEKPVSAVVSQVTNQPPSAASRERLTLNGDQTPPRPTPDPDTSGIKRSGSVRSKLSGRRKHRGSSATAGTSNSIAAALKDSTAGLANPSMYGLGHRLTGFAVASSKRNKDFHQLFRSVPEDDYLIEDYSAALQRDILLHGRLYVSEGHICFSSNILGWVTNLVISFDEVMSVEKKSTAVIFPNAIVIATLNARNTFASFVARDSTYELLIGIWKMSHPNLKSSLNGVQLDDSGTGDKTEVAEPGPASENDTEGTEDEVYDEDADDDAGSFTDGGLVASVANSDIGEGTLSRKPSGMPVSGAQANGAVMKGPESAEAVVTAAAVSSEFPGVPSHEPTQCADGAEHYDRPLTDTTIPAPLGKVYSMMFGPASGAFMRKWLVEEQKSGNLNYTDDKTGLDLEHTSFTFDYIKPLSAPVGPRQTKCITTNTLKAFDLTRAVSVDCSTQTPDVPSGNVFTTKTRYCLMWGPANSTRVIASCTIEWTGKSWLKGPIEKGAEQGQTEYVKAIIAALKAAVTTKPPVKGMPRKGKRKGKKETFDPEEANIQREVGIVAEQRSSSWGILEPMHQILEPVVAIFRPFITSHVIIAVLAILLAYSWMFKARSITAVGQQGYGSPDRIAAYEEIWRREESALWDWLDDRIGLQGLYSPVLDNAQRNRQKTLNARGIRDKLDDRMSERQMDEQIRNTEEKLAALKEAVERRRDWGRAS